MKNHLLLLSLMIAVSFLMTNCTDDTENPSNPKGTGINTVAFADIVDAEVLYLTGSNATIGKRSADTETTDEPENVLFKISYDGATERVIFRDSVGKPIDGIEVTAFRKMSEKYIYMAFDYMRKHAQVIIQKSDGAVFIIDPSKLSNPNYGSGYGDVISLETDFRTDYNGHVYFVFQYRIYKIYTQGGNVYITQINRDDMYPAIYNIGINGDIEWLVDRKGNVLINKEYIRLWSGEFARYEFISLMVDVNPGIFFSWMDSEGFYCLNKWYTEFPSTINDVTIYYCRPESPLSSWQEQKVFTIENANFNDRDFHCFVYENRTVLLQLSEYGNVSIKVTIFDKDNIQLEELPYFTYLNIKFNYYEKNRYPSKEKYLYGMSESEIWRLEVESGKPELLYKYGNEFVIKSMTVKDGIVTFTAFELRGGNDVVGEIYPDKTLNIIKSSNGDQIIYLERM